MTPRVAAKKTPTNTNKSSGEAFAFPSEEETKPVKDEKEEKDDEKEDGMLSKDELYQLLQTRNEELEELKE